MTGIREGTVGRDRASDLRAPPWVGGAVAMSALVLVAFVALQRQRPNLERLPTTPFEVVDLGPDARFLPDDDLRGFVEIPAGAFSMGSDPARDSMAYDVERWTVAGTTGLVDLPPFYLARFETTVVQFRAFVDATRHPAGPDALRGPPDHPVASVSWPDALAYARWLDGALRTASDTPPRLTDLFAEGWRVTLPTEAQWEKAARSADGRVFPWGDRPRRDRANFGGSGTMPVGSFQCPECPFGLADMSGNVWEWTRSPYQPYPYSAADDAEGLDADALWVMRGGSFADDARNARTAVRGGADPGARRPFIGFRVAISPP